MDVNNISVIMNLEENPMNREAIIRHMNNAIEMKEDMKKDNMLANVYYDFDFDKFIEQCEELLNGVWDDAVNIVVPF